MSNKYEYRNNENWKKLKAEIAQEHGVDLKGRGKNGDLTTRQAGSIGGSMVQRIIKNYEQE